VFKTSYDLDEYIVHLFEYVFWISESQIFGGIAKNAYSNEYECDGLMCIYLPKVTIISKTNLDISISIYTESFDTTNMKK
jgi:hypothetical protein